MATLKDVARIAKVSPSTVSYVLSGKKSVRPETEKRVFDAVKALDYTPNLLASGLKTNSSMTVGVIVCDLKQMFFAEMVKHIACALDKEGYCMILCDSENDSEKEKKHLQQLLARNIDGLIIMGNGKNSGFEKLDIPIICIDRTFGESLTTVKTDNILGGMMGTRYLLQKGYRNILFVSVSGLRFTQERWNGYCSAMIEADMADRITELQLEDLYIETAEKNMLEYLDQQEGSLGFDAVFCSTDYIAIGVLRALKKKGIRVPEDVGVMGHDNIDFSGLTDPALTTIGQHKEQIAAACVESLLKMARGKEQVPHQTLFAPYLVERNSC